MSFIRLDRKMLDWGWKDDPNMVALWVHILLSANWKTNEWHGEVYEEGTFPTSVERLSVETGLSTRSVRTCLDKLKKTGEIDTQTTNRGTKISVVKWADFQGFDDVNNKRTANKRQANDTPTDKQTTTLKEYKKTITQERKEYKEKKFVKPSLEEVKLYCKQRANEVDADKWFNYYEANGWKVGKNPMKDWRACVRTWERNTYSNETIPTYDSSKNKAISDSEKEELLKLMGKE